MTLFVLEFGGLRKPFKSVDGTPNMFALLQAKILEKFPAVGLGALLIEITGGSVEDWYAVDNDVDLDDDSKRYKKQIKQLQAMIENQDNF